MKAIAEYFRDLAADDRYFGAEPPTPDAEMLARIAEREIARRVEARTDGSGIVLRVGSALAPTAPQPSVETVRTAGHAALSDEIEPRENDTHPVATATDEPEDAAPAQEAPTEATAARATESGAQSDAQSEDRSTAEPGAGAEVGDVPSPLLAADVPATAPRMPPAPTAPVMERPPVQARPAHPEVAEAAPHTARPVPPAAEVPAHPDADSVAAKLQRIRAVVGLGAAGLAPSADTGEDEGDLAAEAPKPADVAQAAPEAADMDAPDAAEDDPLIRSILAVRQEAPEAVATGSEIAEPEAAEPEAVEAEAEAESVAPVRARVIRMSRADFEAAVAQGRVETDDEIAADDDDETEDRAAAPSEDLAEEMAEDMAEEMAEDLEDAFGFDADEIADLERLDAAEATDFASGTLSPEDEAELLEELAAVERDLAAPEAAADAAVAAHETAAHEEEADDWDDVAEEEAEDVAPAETVDMGEDRDDSFVASAAEETDNLFAGADHDDDEDDAAADAALAEALRRSAGPRRVILEAEPEADEAAMSRLLSRTNAQLEDPEVARRRQSIAQLKAAVAATEAARSLGEDEDDAAGAENAFREDLSRVVRPRRPVAPAAAEARSERPRPAPLKLVAAQRVDLPRTEERPAARGPVVPVRPRRVTVDEAPAEGTAAAARTSGSFAEFAERMGATGLNDLLEAAAAYTSYVEGMEDFSRPQLINKVRQMSAEEFSREDGLRSFGTLLRQGRIMKVRNGRFQIAEDTRFRPERRVG